MNVGVLSFSSVIKGYRSGWRVMLPHSFPGYSVSVGFSPVVTPGGDYVALGDTERVSFAARRTKRNPRKWVVKKRGLKFVSHIRSSS